jgi:hypothetical protein
MPLAATVLLFGAGMHARAQSPLSGSLTGKLTDLHSAPLAGATVVVRNQATGAEARTTTAANGTYRFTALNAGQYSIEADSALLGHGHLDGILVSAGHEARVQTAMRFQPMPSAPAEQALHAIATPAPSPAQVPVVAATLPVQSLPMRPQSTQPPHAQVPLIASTLQPHPLRQMPAIELPTIQPLPPPVPSAALPTTRQLSASAPAATAIPLHAVSAPLSLINSAPVSPNVAISQSVAKAVIAAMQPGLPPARRIQAAAQQGEPVTPAVATNLSASELQSLPVSGRRWEEFALDTPASTAPADSSQTSLRGAGQNPSDISIDGASIQLAFGTPSSSASLGVATQTSSDQGGSEPNGMGQSWSGGRAFGVSDIAIRNVQTVAGNVEAEDAHASGGRTNVQTQSGSNEFHGQGFLYDRQNIWGASNPFTQWVQQTAPGTTTEIPVFGNGPSGTPQSYTPPDHETTWGLGMGSRIRRDKLFWFGALDSYNRNDPGVSMVKHPYLETTSNCGTPPCPSTITGFFAQPSNNQVQLLGAQLGTSNNAALASYSKMLETLVGLLGPSPRTAAQWTGFARIDWQAAERHRFTLEAIGANWNSPGGGLTRVSENYGNHSYGSTQGAEQWMLARWEAFLTPNLLATTQASAGHNILSAHAEMPSAFEQTLDQNIWGQLPQIVVDSRYGFTIGNPSRFGPGSYPDERLYQAQESVDWVRGNLLIKAGFDVDHNADTIGLLRNQTGTYSYSKIENFISDALVFGAFGLSDALDKFNPHNCDQTGKAWQTSTGQLMGLGNLPCYSSYSQTMGPTNWQLSTNDWAGFSTAQWQPGRFAVFSAGLRWEREQLPPPIAALNNPALPLTEKLPDLGNQWGPRVSLALGSGANHWPLLRLGYGMYFGRTENATLETALTQTGSLSGDLNFFMRPTDNLNAGGAPPFPYVFAGEPLNLVKPGAVEFAPNFRNPEIHQAVASIEETLPGHIELTAAALLSLGRRLPIPIDANFDPAVNPGTITYNVVDGAGLGPIKASQITVPFYATWPVSGAKPDQCAVQYPQAFGGTAGWCNQNYQQISEFMSRANSTYEAAMLKLTRYGRRGLSLHAHYTYAHAMDWNPNQTPLDPSANFKEEYGTSNLDVRHSAAIMAIYETPWKMQGLAGRLADGWMLSGVGNFRSGLPYTMHTSGSLPEEFTSTGAAIVGLRSGMNGSGGDNRVYGVGNNNVEYNIGRNTYRYPETWKADLRLGKRFDLGELRQLELLAESFNLFNHQNVTEIETNGYYVESGSPSSPLPTLNFLTGPTVEANGKVVNSNSTAFGQPLNINATNFYRERQIQFGLRLRF